MRLSSFIFKLLDLKNKKPTERDKQRERKTTIDNLIESDMKHQQSKEAKKQQLQLRREQEAQVRSYARTIPKLLANQKAASVHKQIRKGRERRVLNKVKILAPYYVLNDFYMLKVDTVHLPYGVSVSHLCDENVLASVSAGLETPIEAKLSKKYGLWYIVPRTDLARIPEKIEYHKVVSLLPPSANSWIIPLGVTENNKLLKLDFRKKPHILVAGSTGSGKSVFLKNIILTLALNNSPDRIRFIIADFKGGADFVKFTKLPHLGATSAVSSVNEGVEDIEITEDSIEIVNKKTDYFADTIINEPNELEPILKWAKKETKKRNGIFAKLQRKNIDVTNINEYNSKFRRKPMPHIVLILDEFPVAMYSSSKKAITELIISIASLGRSAGIHLILGAQVASSKVLAGGITQNIGTRFAGFSTGPQSQIIVGSWLAAKIPNKPGRMAYRSDLEQIEMQAPWISPKLASTMLAEIEEKWATDPDADPVATKLFKFALAEKEGYYAPDEIHRYFKDDDEISRAVTREIGKEYEIKEGQPPTPIIIDENVYYLLAGIPGRRNRKLILKSEYEAKNAPTVPLEPKKVKNEAVRLATQGISENSPPPKANNTPIPPNSKNTQEKKENTPLDAKTDQWQQFKSTNGVVSDAEALELLLSELDLD